MRSDVARSIALVMLMIVSVQMPMFDNAEEPAELKEEKVVMESPADPCLGYDACLGVDAGGYMNANTICPGGTATGSCAIMDLTNYVDYGSTTTSTSFYGSLEGGQTTDPTYDDDDIYKLTVPWGYGFDITFDWNGTNDMMDVYMGLSCGTSYSSCNDLDTSGASGMGESMSTSGSTVDGLEVFIWIECYSVYCSSASGFVNDYRMTFDTWPADNGVPGDWSAGATLLELYDGCTFGPPNQDCSGSSTYWTTKTGTFTVSGSATASVQYMCDYGPYSPALCSYGSYAQVEKPDGTIDSFQSNPGTQNPVSTPIELSQYTDAGTYTVTMFGGSYGYGHLSIKVIDVTPPYPMVGLTTTTSLPSKSVYGVVGNTDTNDYFQVVIPVNSFANITLDWDQNVDLDLRVYTDVFSTLHAASYSDQPEVIDLSSLGDDVTVWVKVSYYGPSSTDPASGYKLTLNLMPTVFPPCWYQDDGAAPGTGAYDGTGVDAADDDADTPGPLDVTGVNTFTGMLCDTSDEEDWYAITVPAYHGAWVKLNWTQVVSSDDLRLYLYMDRGYSYPTTVASASSTALDGVATATTNESSYWDSAFYGYFEQDTTLWINVDVYRTLTSEMEFNYTVTYETYNMSGNYWAGPWDDAGSGTDAGNSSSSTLGAVTLLPMNNTYTGYAHDDKDKYDQYEIYVPEGYTLRTQLTVTPGDAVSLYIKYQRPGYSYLSTLESDTYYDHQKDLYAPLGYGGQNMYITIYQNVGGGAYTLEVTMVTEDNDPNAADDCGLGVDASNSRYVTGWDDATWLNSSSAIDANGDADDTGGTCTGWIDRDWDLWDIYYLNVPAGKYVEWNVTWDPQMTSVTSTTQRNLDVTMYLCQQQDNWCNSATNPAYYVSQQDSRTGWSNGSSGLWVTNGGWLLIEIGGGSTYSGMEFLDYTMTITYSPLSNLRGGVQNDSGSNLDAGPGEPSAIHVNDFVTMASNMTLTWNGWNDPQVDTTDRYTFDVPADYGYEFCVTHDDIQYPTGGFTAGTAYIIADAYGSTANPTPTNTYVSSAPLCWSTNTTGDYHGDDVNQIGVRNWLGASFPVDDGTNYTVTVTFFTLDTDGDGWYDTVEVACGSNETVATDYPGDIDGDGICDALDTDTDGDGVIDSEDTFPDDNTETSDLDGDGIGDNTDDDRDDDNWNNTNEIACMTDPDDTTSTPGDADGDGICDYIDTDDDNDGVDDLNDIFPNDSTEWADSDQDEIGDNADLDDDNDQYEDLTEIDCLSDPFDVSSIPEDLDLDGTCDALDSDKDDDGYDNDVDVFPEDPAEWIDTDGDGFGNNVDTDDDNDIVLDTDDVFPLDSTEWLDTDADGVGDNSDLNDDGDAWTDSDEATCGSDPMDSSSVPVDYDGDGICDKVDTDDDGDGTPDTSDAFPYDAMEFADFDSDGTGDFSDTDDDNDGWMDIEEPNCGTDSMDALSVPADNDRDGQCDIVDQDDDNDGIIDLDDMFPMNPDEASDLDGDGVGDNSDTDDDGDGWLDITEDLCLRGVDGIIGTADDGFGNPYNANEMPIDNETVGPGLDEVYGTADDVIQGDGICNSLDPDDDNDGVPDAAVYTLDANGVCTTCEEWEDHFQWDPSEQFDANGDGKGDNGAEPSFLDNVQADTLPFAGAGIGIIGMLYLVSRQLGGKEEDSEFEEYDETEQFEDDEDIEELAESLDEDEA